MKTSYTNWMETIAAATKITYQSAIGSFPQDEENNGFYKHLLINNTIDWLEWAMENTEKVKTLNLEEMRTLMSMLKSSDEDNVYMGLEIIKNKVGYYESNI
jgi:predicted molibdopterin-dependent oxidoreductase YjgC